MGKIKKMIPLVCFHLSAEIIDKFSTEITNHAILLQNIQVNGRTLRAPNECLDDTVGQKEFPEEFSPSQYIRGISLRRDTMPNIPIFGQDCIFSIKKTWNLVRSRDSLSGCQLTKTFLRFLH